MYIKYLPVLLSVGSGAGGTVVATRLVETGAQVLLIEAGRSAPLESAVPGFATIQIGSETDWHVRLAQQRYSQLGYYDNVRCNLLLFVIR